MHEFSGTFIGPGGTIPFPGGVNPFPGGINPFPFARDQEQNNDAFNVEDDDGFDEVDDSHGFNPFDVNVQHQHQHQPNQHQFPTQIEKIRPYNSSNKKKTSSKLANSQTDHTKNSAHPPYIVGAAISPAIIPLTYYPIQPGKSGGTTEYGSSKKTRQKPSNKPSTDTHQKVALNAVPLIWYPADAVYNPNLQRNVNEPNQSKQHAISKQPTKSQTSKQSDQIQAMNLAAYYGYLNHLNSRQKQPTQTKSSN